MTGQTPKFAGLNWRVILAVAVFVCLPTVGAFGGGAYAALVGGLAFILFVADLAAKRGPRIDVALAALAIPFVVLLWLGALWSIAPARTVSGDAQMTGIFVIGLVLLGLQHHLTGGADRIFKAGLIAAIVGPLLLCLDLAIGHPILTLASGPKADEVLYFTKLSRGLGQLSILIWPLIAFGWLTGRRVLAIVATVIFTALLLWQMQNNLAITLCFATGLVVWGAATIAPRVVAAVLAVIVSVVAVGVPFIIQAFARQLMDFADSIKSSARHRLEIWDYLTDRVLERPLFGWGWQTAQLVPVTPDEKAHYKYFWKSGIPHPHDFWVQLWLETGVIGLLLGLAFTLIVLRRINQQPQDIRPFALASFATAFTMSLASFNLSTDTWWYALAATGLLFALLRSARQSLA